MSLYDVRWQRHRREASHARSGAARTALSTKWTEEQYFSPVKSLLAKSTITAYGTIANTASVSTSYNVTVTAAAGRHTARETFSWTVSNAGVKVANPGEQPTTPPPS